MDQLAAMKQATELAHLVEGRTAPRPPVGAIVVRNGQVIGAGATSPPYGPHAEIHALQQADAQADGADLYVTLEPCCVTIHTPPCTEAIITAGIRRVFVGLLDANPQVCGRGVEQLRAAGIEVITGINVPEITENLRPFACFITRGRPYVTAKWAMTLDGKIATSNGDARWISSPAARQWVHCLRDRVDAILVGAGTVLADDPQLTVRLPSELARTPRSGPLRVVLSSFGLLPPQSKLLQPELASGTCLLVGECADDGQLQALRALGVEVVTLPSDLNGRPLLSSALTFLASKGLMHVLLEGGNRLLGSAFDQQLIDHIAVFIAPKIIGGVLAPTPIGGAGLSQMAAAASLQPLQIQQLGEDMLIEGEVCYER